jgi:hypothetical protein
MLSLPGKNCHIQAAAGANLKYNSTVIVGISKQLCLSKN